MRIGMPALLAAALLALALPTAGSARAGGLQGQEPKRVVHATAQEKHLLEVTLRSGLEVRHVVYRTEPLGGKSLLQVKRQSGLTLSSRDGETVQNLSEGEFDELMSGLLAIVHREHHDQLDSIQIDLALVDPLWSDSVEHLREADIAPDYTVDPKSNAVLAAMQSYLSGSALVKTVCEQVATIGRRCRKHAVSMNPVAFRSPRQSTKWGEARLLPDAGIEKESVWFAIDIEEQ